MSAVSKFARAVSLRDKTRSTSKPRNQEWSLFTLDESKKRLSKDEQHKVQEISQEFHRLGKHDIPDSRIEYALRSRSAQGDVKEAIRLLSLYEDSIAGVLRPYNPKTRLLGAENREKTTCWLDSLLFAMFAQTDVFEAVLHHQYEDEERKRLVEALRLWVNLLRTGRLITTDFYAIAECGWPEASRTRQQDASEAFNFITDKLQLPLLTLKTDIYHQGKEDANDDHKFITERMLDVAIPENLPLGEVLRLESCLEDYFNNRVEVKRLLARRNTLGSSDEPSEKTATTQVEIVEVDSKNSSPAPSPIDERKPSRPIHMRIRATSIFSERKVEVTQETNGRTESTTSTKKEVLMPAWQFLNLIPWYTDNVPEGNSQVRAHFSQRRMMLGICLKRYGVHMNGASYRRSTHIDIPLEMASPHFTTGDDVDRTGTDTRNFKLVLKSFVCHRGHSVDAGHYISFVRVDAARSDRHETFSDAGGDRSQTHDQTHDAWLKHDDLAMERVTTVDIKKVLKEESPDLLFYRVQAIDDELPEETPPPYQESEAPLDYIDQKLATLSEPRTSAEQKSNRPSIEITSEEPRGRVSATESRRQSIVALSSNGSLRVDISDQPPTEQASPLSSTRAVSPAVSKTTKNGKADGEDTGRRFSMNMSKLRLPTLGKDKSNTDVVVRELDDVPATTLDDTTDESITKGKDKRRMFKTLKRRGSGGNALNKPERECSVM